MLGLIAHDMGKNDIVVDLISRAVDIDPDYVDAYNSLGNVLRIAGRLDESVASFQKALVLDPDFAEAHYNLAIVLRDLGRRDDAVASYHKALTINPDFAGDHNNDFMELGEFDDFLTNYQQAVSLNPDSAEAHNNLGSKYIKLWQLEETTESINRSLVINPDYDEAYNNLVVALHLMGKHDESVVNYNKSIDINPDSAIVHSNLGLTLQSLGRIDEAIDSYKNSLSINPDLHESLFRLPALLIDPENMTPSIKSLEKAVKINPSNLEYRFVLGMVLDFSGDQRTAATHFDMVETGTNIDRARLDAWHYIKSTNKKIPPITGTNIQAFKLGIDAAVNDGLVLEFAVRFGTSIRQIATLAEQEVHGFDSFEGLPESWHNEPEGSYSTKGEIPSVTENVILHDGWFEETLPRFIENHPEPVRFLNIDCDIYSSTKTVLDLLAKQIISGTVIVFDEYIVNENWREDEFKAFQESVLTYGWKYEYLYFSFFTKQVVVRIH